MNADERRLKIDEITQTIIGSAYEVSNTLGVGFLEKVYETALALELRHRGLEVLQQHEVNVYYRGSVVGFYKADLLVENLVIIEMKVVKAFDEIHMAQCLNYLKATRLTTCLMLNFAQSRVEVKRIVSNF